MQLESDNLQSKINAASKEIGALMAKGDKGAADVKKQEVASFKNDLQPIADELATTETVLNDKLVLLPNLPSVLVPAGKTPADNEVVRTGGQKPVLPDGAVPHWELIKKYDIVDFETGAKITGSGFPCTKGKAQNCKEH
jgi:seryl-tRNA synthetase